MFAFVFRRMMDFDHMLPVAVAVANAGEHVRLGVMGGGDAIRRDPRLSLFPARTRVARLGPLLVHTKCSWFLRGAHCLVMDWVKRGQHVTQTLTDIARRRGIPSVALPHSVDIVVDDRYYDARIDGDTFSHFDTIVVPNDIRRSVLTRAGIPSQRLEMLGSARFTRAWSDRVAAVFPPKQDTSNGRLKVAYFDVMTPQRFEPTIGMLRRLADTPGVDLAIQPKAVNYPIEMGRTLTALFPKNIEMSHATRLCQWADVVIGVSTSVMIEALIQGRHLIWPKYLDPDPMAFDETRACWIADNGDQLLDLIRQLRDGTAPPRPDPLAFLQTFVHGGRPEESVIPDYVKLLKTTAARASAQRRGLSHAA